MAIVDCVELALNVGYEQIWRSEIKGQIFESGKSGKKWSSNDVQIFSRFSFSEPLFFAEITGG